MKKYLLGTLTMLALCMCLLTVPVSAATVASGTCGGEGDGSNLTWFLYDGGRLTIFGMGAMANWSHISDVPWSAYINDIKTVEFRDSVTTIGGWAFSGCASLTNVEIPASVTTIGDYAFFSCDDLTSVELGVSVTTIGDSVFSGCADLTGVELPTNVTTIGGSAFEGCSSLTEVTFKGSAPSFGTDVFLGVTANSYYPSNDATWTESVRQNYGGKLTWIEKEINHTVASGTCGGEGDGSNLTWVFTDDGTLTISGAGAMANWSHISDVPWSAYINDITTVEIGDSVTTIGDNAFNFCTSLTSVEIGDSVTAIGDSAFYCCVNLTSIAIGDSVTSIGSHVFESCLSLTDFVVSETNPAYCIDDYGVLFSKDETVLYCYPAGKTMTEYSVPDGVIRIGDSAFFQCSNLTSVNIPDSVTRIGVSAFSDCYSLSSIEIPDSVTSIGDGAFSACSSLTRVKLGDGVTYINNYAFSLCTSLTSVEIGAGVTWIGVSAFSDCDSLTNITVSEGNPVYCTDSEGVLFSKDKTILYSYPTGKTQTAYSIPNGVISISDSAFSSCVSLVSVEIPDSVISIGNWAFQHCSGLASVEIPNGVISIGRSAFDSCESMTSVEIGSSVTSIGDGVFLNCHSLTNITVSEENPAYCTDSVGVLFSKDKTVLYCCPPRKTMTEYSIPDSVINIGVYAFYDCNSLISVEIPDSVTGIGDNAFFSCNGLTSVKIGDSVISIGDGAFTGCVSLTEVIFEGSAISFGRDVFRLVTANCYYPSNDATWTEFVKQNYGGTLTWIEMGTSASYDALTSTVTLHTLPADTEVIYIAAYDDGKLISIISGTLGSDNFIPRAVQADEIKVFYLGNSCQPVAGDYRINLS